MSDELKEQYEDLRQSMWYSYETKWDRQVDLEKAQLKVDEHRRLLPERSLQYQALCQQFPQSKANLISYFTHLFSSKSTTSDATVSATSTAAVHVESYYEILPVLQSKLPVSNVREVALLGVESTGKMFEKYMEMSKRRLTKEQVQLTPLSCIYST